MWRKQRRMSVGFLGVAAWSLLLGSAAWGDDARQQERAERAVLRQAQVAERQHERAARLAQRQDEVAQRESARAALLAERKAERAIERDCLTPPLQSANIPGTATFDRRVIQPGGRVEPVVDPLTGTFADVPPGTDIWVLVYPHLAGKYYQQTHHPDFGPATLEAHGEFRTSASFGGGAGELYDVALVFATPRASAELRRILGGWAAERDFRGLTLRELPQGLDQKDCVIVSGRRRG